MNYVLGTGGNCRFRWEIFEFKCLVCEEKVESKSKTERQVLSYFLEESALEYAMEGREEEAKKEEEEEEDPWLLQAFDVGVPGKGCTTA